MASSKDKKYPPGQKPSSKTPAKPTMAQAFNAAQGAAVNRPYGPGNPKPTPSLFPKGNSSQGPKDTRSAAQRIVEAEKGKTAKPTPGSAAANRESLKNVGSSIVGFFAKGGIPAVGKPEGFNKPSSSKPVPPKEKADIVAQGKAADKKANTARMATDAKYDKVGAKKATSSSTSTTKAAKPYVKLKQAPREAARRAYVQKQLDRLGIKPTPAGKPRSAKEKAARAKARATWDKKNKFQKKSGPQSGGSGSMENRPE